MDFLQDEFGDNGEWDEAMLLFLRSLALSRPVEVENRLRDGCPVEAVRLKAFYKRSASRLPNPKDPKKSKKLLELAIVRNLELAILVTLLIGKPLQSVQSDFVMKKEVEFWCESLSIHYAIDVKPSAAFVAAVQAHGLQDKRMSELIVDICGLPVDEDEDGDDIGGESVEDDIVLDATPAAATPVESSAMSPLSLNSHWSRLKSKTLRRRSTDTDLSKLVDLPPLPPRLSQTRSTASTGTPKRKGVLVHVGDLSQASTTTLGDNEVMAFETPVKMRRGQSQLSQTSTTIISSTQLTGDTSGGLVVLETPPRASIGATMAFRIEGSTVSKFELM